MRTRLQTAGTGLTKWTSSAPWTLGIYPYVHPGRTRCMRHGLPHARRIGRGMLLLLLPLRAFGHGRTGKFVDRAVAAGTPALCEAFTERRGSGEIENLPFSSENVGAGDNEHGIPCFNNPSVRVTHNADYP